MPELPEVEITTRNLNKILKPPTKIKGWTFYRQDLRNKIPIQKIEKANETQLIQIYRRAKFIVFEFKKHSVVSHLGMTGNWRIEKVGWEKRKHDHIALNIDAKNLLVYNDPRRFGEFDFYKNEEVFLRFQQFGPEPLQAEVDWTHLTQQFQNLKSAVKVCLMNQKYLVGIGNIYASEALHRAQILPHKLASEVTTQQYKKLWLEVKKVLEEAIVAGGSSISDFKNSYGQQGDFQKKFLVYDRKDELCRRCHHPIQAMMLGGRSTFWCDSCQK